jgi:hypothetical protein
MCSGNGQGPCTDQITNIADDESLVSRVTSNAATLLQVPGISKEHHTGNPVLHCLGTVLDRRVIDGRALAVATRHDDGVRASARSIGKQVAKLSNASRISIPGQEVGGQSSRIVHAFNSDTVVTELLLESAS